VVGRFADSMGRLVGGRTLWLPLVWRHRRSQPLEVQMASLALSGGGPEANSCQSDGQASSRAMRVLVSAGHTKLKSQKPVASTGTVSIRGWARGTLTGKNISRGGL